jgi:8-oxo-dGTP pyrophosphatase MutT (NUDIX family)
MDDARASQLASRIRFEGRVFSVHTDRVRLPNGHESDVDIVRHPGSVVLVAIDDRGQVILIRQYRYSIDRWVWELPAGRIEPGESVDAAVGRECEEEIGLVPGRLEAVGAFYPSPGFCDEIMRFYRVSDLRRPPADSTVQRDADEDLTVRTFAIDEARRMVRDGEIVDLKTAFGLQLV